MVRDIERVLGERIERRQMPGFDWPVVETARRRRPPEGEAAPVRRGRSRGAGRWS